MIGARLPHTRRDILAVPGNIDAPLCKGTNYLLQQGAKLVTCSQDILDEFGLEAAGEEQQIPDFSEKERKILDIMPGNEVNSIDYFVENLNYSVSETISLLMGLVLKNVIVKEAGGYKRVE